MQGNEKKEYVKNWQKKHILRMRYHKLKWYYKNRKMINLMFSKANGIEPDEADEYYFKKHPEG